MHSRSQSGPSATNVSFTRLESGTGAAEPDTGALAEFLFLVVTLAALAAIPVPGITAR